MKKVRKPVSIGVAALIITCSGLTPLCIYNLYHAILPTSPVGVPVIDNLGGFDRFGSLGGLTLHVGGRAFVCGGAAGLVQCQPKAQ